jgi:hypothetical protein
MVLRRRLAASVRGRYSVRTMAKTLTRNGNSLALTIDKPILEATGIVISPVRSKKRTAKLEEILGKLDREYAGVFRRLAE